MSQFNRMAGFAEKFKPIFRACDLAKFCQKPSERTELQFVAKYYPFKKYIHKKNVLRLANQRPKISERHVMLVQKEWERHFNEGKTLTFNDEVLTEKLFKDIDKKVQNLVTAMEIDVKHEGGDMLIESHDKLLQPFIKIPTTAQTSGTLAAPKSDVDGDQQGATKLPGKTFADDDQIAPVASTTAAVSSGDQVKVEIKDEQLNKENLLNKNDPETPTSTPKLQKNKSKETSVAIDASKDD